MHWKPPLVLIWTFVILSTKVNVSNYTSSINHYYTPYRKTESPSGIRSRFEITALDSLIVPMVYCLVMYLSHIVPTNDFNNFSEQGCAKTSILWFVEPFGCFKHCVHEEVSLKLTVHILWSPFWDLVALFPCRKTYPYLDYPLCNSNDHPFSVVGNITYEWRKSFSYQVHERLT